MERQNFRREGSSQIQSPRKLQQELSELQEENRAILKKSSDGIVLISQQDIIVEANQKFANLIGLPLSDLVGLNLSNLVYESDPTERVKLFEPAVKPSVSVST